MEGENGGEERGATDGRRGRGEMGGVRDVFKAVRVSHILAISSDCLLCPHLTDPPGFQLLAGKRPRCYGVLAANGTLKSLKTAT